MSTATIAPTDAAQAPSPKPSRKRWLLMAAVLALAAGAGGGWYAWQQRGGDAAAGHPKAEPKPQSRKQLYIALEPFTVNLQDTRGERFAQIGVTLQVEDPSVEVELKDRLPAVRNQILILISSKRIEELLTPEGKQSLAQQIRGKTGQALGLGIGAPATPAAPGKAAEPENPIKDVLFSQFIVQ